MRWLDRLVWSKQLLEILEEAEQNNNRRSRHPHKEENRKHTKEEHTEREHAGSVIGALSVRAKEDINDL